MATRIRLRRVGRKKQPEFRIVVIERTKARDGRFVETIGHYNPRRQPVTLSVDVEKARQWLDKGATPSTTVKSLLKKAGVFGKAGATVETGEPEDGRTAD
jgi:small subunit ribosomal protein S16